MKAIKQPKMDKNPKNRFGKTYGNVLKKTLSNKNGIFSCGLERNPPINGPTRKC
jgi:hypothetical protein